MAAALACLRISEKEKVASSVMKLGKEFCEQFEALAEKFGVPLKMTGVPSMPYPWIEGDENLFQIQKLCKVATKYGLYFHPHHNWFISNAMKEKDVLETLTLSEKVFEHFLSVN